MNTSIPIEAFIDGKIRNLLYIQFTLLAKVSILRNPESTAYRVSPARISIIDISL